MNADEIQVGGKYRVDATGSRPGFYEVRSVRQNKLGQTEITAKHQLDSYARTFLPENFREEVTKKADSKAKRIVSEEIKVIADLGDVLMVLEDVKYWPAWGKRGRPRKVVNA